jgi:hypothetical protein
MFCINCGSALREGAKFCGSCGTKVEGGAAAAGPKLLQLAELPGNLPRCKVSIREVTAEGPDDDGDMGFKVQYVVENDSGEDWEHLTVRTVLLDGSGQIIDETYDTTEQTMPAGEEVEMEAWMGGINAALFAGKPDNGQVVVHVVASRLHREKLGSFVVPSEPQSLVPLRSCTIGDKVKIVSGSLWRTAPDSDKDCRVVLKVLCQNLTEAWLPAVKVEAKLTDKMDRDIDSLDQTEELRPGAIATIDCSTSVKQNKLAGGVTATVAVNVFTPVAASVGQHFGVTSETVSEGRREGLERLSPSHSKQDRQIDDDPLDSDFYREQRFYGNMKWFSVAEQPQSFDQLPPEFLQAKKLWHKDAEGNIDKVIELLSPYVGARFIASNISGWEELFADFDGSGLCEIESSEVRVVGIAFSEGPIPMCKAEASFNVPVTRAFEAIDLDEWQEDNGRFTDAVIFYWNAPRGDETEDLDFTCGDNQGVECNALDGDDTKNSNLDSNNESETEAMQWNGCWEIRSARIICRWILVWQEVQGCTVGAIGGYSGGGGFQLETFVIQDNKIISSAEESLSESVEEQIVQIAENCIDRALEFHETDVWFDSDNLILRSDKKSLLIRTDDLLAGGVPISPSLIPLFKITGLISRPNSSSGK